jgi:hypothetical protein
MGDIKKMRAQIVRPGGRGKTVLIALIVTLVFAAVDFYISLPAINLHNPDFYGFLFVCTLVYCLVAAMASGLLKKEPREAWDGLKRNCRPALILCALLLLTLIIGSVLGSVILRSRAYTGLLDVQEGDFTADVKEVSFNEIPMLDKTSAQRLGDRRLGQLSDVVSQFEVNDDYSQINYRGKPVRVATLRYGDFFKWINNMNSGLPAYIIIDMVTQNAQVVRLDEGMKYGSSEHFGRNLTRYLRFKYPTYLFDECNFEIDDDGTPYWVCSRAVRTIGLFGGTDICGAVLVNAVTGESKYYDVADIPTWVDRVFSAELLISQYDYYGMYKNGYLNSIFGQKGVTVTTEGYNYIAMDDDVYVYTGITSVGGDQSNIGFILCNQRTKETKFFSCAGAEEFSAMSSAEGVVQHLNYSATFPLLLNISGQPTYFMSLKDDAELVKMYAMVNVQQYNIVATGTTVSECESNYIKLLAQDEDGGAEAAADVTGIITDIRSAVIEGNTWYYFRLEGDDFYYSISAASNELAVLLNIGDSVTVTPAQTTGDIRTALSVK